MSAPYGRSGEVGAAPALEKKMSSYSSDTSCSERDDTQPISQEVSDVSESE